MSDTDYDNFLQYLTAEHFVSSSVIITLFVLLIIIGVVSSSEYSKTPLYVLGSVSVLLLGLFLLYQYNNYTSFEKDYTRKQQQKKEQEEAEAEAEREASLEENAICNVNPNLCMHGGSCQSFGPDKQQYRCNCTAGWTGNNCNTPDNITIKDSDIDPRCSDKTTGEKNVNLEWCGANFDGKGGKCVDKQKYQIECPINRDGSPNYKYNEYGCDVENDEMWCPETSADQIGKCVVRSPGEVGEPCNVRTIGQDCLGNPDLIWDNGRQTCVPDCGRGQVYNKNLEKCITYNCSQYSSSSTCSGSGVNNYCRWNNTESKCVIDRSTRQCQSLGKNRCQNSETCTWSNGMCYDNDSSDCQYITSRNHCQIHPQCSWNSANNICEECSDGQDCIQGGRGGRRFSEGFKVGGRIKKNGFTVSSEGFVQGGYSEY